MKTVFVEDYTKFLRERGIDLLTGEADGTSIRGLFDLTPSGEELLGEFLGGAEFHSPGWNSGHSSVLLPYEMTKPLVRYILLREGCNVVVQVDENTESWYASYIRGYEGEQDEIAIELDLVRELHKSARTWWKSGTARNGMRNQHVFSGRIE